MRWVACANSGSASAKAASLPNWGRNSPPTPAQVTALHERGGLRGTGNPSRVQALVPDCEDAFLVVVDEDDAGAACPVARCVCDVGDVWGQASGGAELCL